jgi:hypothetical protein
MSSRLSRRTLLRGALGGALLAVPLPRLACMLDGNGTAYADGKPLPLRFGTWFFGNGIIPARWNPQATGTGAAWALSEALAPLLPVKPWLSVVSGMQNKVPGLFAHKSYPAGALTGAQAVQAGDVQAPSIDQLIARTLPVTAFPSGLHLGLCNTTGAGALDLCCSFSGPNQPNAPDYSPLSLFNKLMPFSSSTRAVDPSLLRRKRILDAVREDASALRTRLGAEDKVRLDRHLEGVDELQKRLVTLSTPQLCGDATNPDVAYAQRGPDGAITRARNQAFVELLVFAMSCDVTRVFTYLFSSAACHGSYADAGLDNVTFHEDYGHRKSPRGTAAATEGFQQGIVYTMARLNELLVRMKDTSDVTGNLLDNSCVYITSCVAESVGHGNTDYPLLVAGKASGALKGDVHLRTNGESVGKVPFTLLKALGGTATSFGLAEGRVDTGLSGLLA